MSHDANLVRNLIALKKRSLDVKFDLTDSGYTPLENIGSGAYGVVCRALHEKSKTKVAIKKIPNIFDATTTAKRTYREIRILKHFRHDNVIAIREILRLSDPMRFKDVYVVLDLMESDLHQIIHSHQPLSEEHVRYFLYQILRGLKYIHSAKVIHRDLKPSNLLINENCELKIGDFGMARSVSWPAADQHKACMTQYVATRWYRAPELIMLFVDYTEAVDMWSVGCILAEMLGRKQIFPGKDVLSQLQMIISSLGSPSDELLRRSQSEIVQGLVRSIKVTKTPVSLKTMYPKASRKAIDILSRLLVIDPSKRLSADQALKHLFVNKYHDPDDEPTCPPFDFTFDAEPMTSDALRAAILAEANTFADKRPIGTLTPPQTEQETANQEPPEQDLLQQQQILDLVQQQTELQPSVSIHVTPDTAFKAPIVPGRQLHVPYSTGAVLRGSALSTPSLDVEMLSAKSNADNVEMLSAHSVKEPETRPEICPLSTQLTTIVPATFHPPALNPSIQVISLPVVPANPPVLQIPPQRPNLVVSTKPTETKKTISEDTRMLIKAALLQSGNRKKTDNRETVNLKRPITAHQRQKEREERRRKKNEKAHERKKKQKEKPPESCVMLSQEDKSMLQRWETMARTSIPDPRTQGNDQATTEPADTTALLHPRDWSADVRMATPKSEESLRQTHQLLGELESRETARLPNLTATLEPTESHSGVRPKQKEPILDTLSPSKAEVEKTSDPVLNSGLGVNPAVLNSYPSTSSGASLPARSKLVTLSPSTNDESLDLIADVTRQFSRSQVEDLFPPLLAVTPKGTGEGYGVGLDLDEILQEWISSNKDHESARPDSAPLSASLLADWLEVAGNMDAQDVEELQRELSLCSPMVLTE